MSVQTPSRRQPVAAWEEGRTNDTARIERAARTANAWAAMRWQWENTQLPSVKQCRRSCIPGPAGAQIALDGAGRASVSGLRSCGSVWACPLCSAAIWAKRGRDLQHLLRAAEAAGMKVGFITLTMRHRRTNALETLWDAMQAALTRALGAGSRSVQKLRAELGVVGVVRRIECTFGASGFHLHPHLLVFSETGDEAEFKELGNKMFDAWSAALAARGLPAPARKHGVVTKMLDLSRAEEEAASYVTTAGSFKASAEMTDRHGKHARHGNRSMWQVLDDARAGDKQSKRVWQEWEAVSRGRCAWDCRSAALRQLAEEYVEPSADDQAEPPAPVVQLSDREWQAVCFCQDPAVLLVAAEQAYRDGLIASNGDRSAALAEAAWALHEILARWGIRA